MVIGEYIPERVLPQMIERVCDELGLNYQVYCDGWLLRITNDQQAAFVFGYTFSLNSSSAAEIAKDKVATYHVLHGAGVSVVPHYLLRPPVHGVVTSELINSVVPDDVWPLVVKPLEGSSGKYVFVIEGAGELREHCNERGGIVWAASPLMQAKSEIRVVILDGQVQLIYRKVPRGSESTDMPLYNLGLGAQAQMIDPSDEVYSYLVEIAQQTVQAMQLRVAAVDVFQLPDGSYSVLEVNASIAFEHFARQSAQNWQAAMACYKAILQKIFY